MGSEKSLHSSGQPKAANALSSDEQWWHGVDRCIGDDAELGGFFAHQPAIHDLMSNEVGVQPSARACEPSDLALGTAEPRLQERRRRISTKRPPTSQSIPPEQQAKVRKKDPG